MVTITRKQAAQQAQQVPPPPSPTHGSPASQTMSGQSGKKKKKFTPRVTPILEVPAGVDNDNQHVPGHPSTPTTLPPESLMHTQNDQDETQASDQSSIDLEEQDLQQLNWNADDQPIPWLCTFLQFTIPMDILTTPFPHGMNLSTNCQTWITQLGIHTWDDLAAASRQHNALSLMRALSIQTYYNHRNDMRIFMAFGMLSFDLTYTPIPEGKDQWLPLLIRKLQMDYALCTYQDAEKLAATTLLDNLRKPVPGFVQSKGGME